MSRSGRHHRRNVRETWDGPAIEFRDRGTAASKPRPFSEPEEVETAANRALDEIEDRVRIVLAAGGEAALQARLARLVPAAVPRQALGFTVKRSGPGRLIVQLCGEGSSVLAECPASAADMAAVIIEAAKA